MKNEFVPYDIALGAKEIGFDEPTICSYYKGGQGLYMGNPTHLDDVQAPLYQQAFRWFMEKYKPLVHEHIWQLSWYSPNEDLDACLRKLIEIVKERKS